MCSSDCEASSRRACRHSTDLLYWAFASTIYSNTDSALHWMVHSDLLSVQRTPIDCVLFLDDRNEASLRWLRAGSLPSLAAAVRLTDLDLSGNLLSGSLPILPVSIQSVDFSDNAFTGSVPPTYGPTPPPPLPPHPLISPRSTRICGGASKQYVVLSVLKAPRFSQCSAPGVSAFDVEAAVGAPCVRLERLVLALTSRHVMCAGNLTALKTLSAADNALSGPIPAALAAAPKLAAVDLTNNTLSGELGRYAAALPAGSGGPLSLQLSHNRLTGADPPGAQPRGVSQL